MKDKYKRYYTLTPLMEREKTLKIESISRGDIISKSSEINIGDMIEFGTYNNKPIQWKVLDRVDNKALLLSKYCLLNKSYNEKRKLVKWKDCTLRKWLNSIFLNNFFTKEEKQQIIQNTSKKSKYTYITNKKKDKIFLLSVNEVGKYFSSNEERKATYDDGVPSWWWLQSSGYLDSYAARVLPDGSIGKNGSFVDNENVAVRPALWVNLESKHDWIKKI